MKWYSILAPLQPSNIWPMTQTLRPGRPKDGRLDLPGIVLACKRGTVIG